MDVTFATGDELVKPVVLDASHFDQNDGNDRNDNIPSEASSMRSIAENKGIIRKYRVIDTKARKRITRKTIMSSDPSQFAKIVEENKGLDKSSSYLPSPSEHTAEGQTEEDQNVNSDFSSDNEEPAEIIVSEVEVNQEQDISLNHVQTTAAQIYYNDKLEPVSVEERKQIINELVENLE